MRWRAKERTAIWAEISPHTMVSRQVIPALKRDHYDLVLLDIMLPGCSGYDICRTVRDEIDIPILMVTARSEAVDVIRGLGLGADDPGCGDRAPHLEGVEAWAGAEAS